MLLRCATEYEDFVLVMWGLTAPKTNNRRRGHECGLSRCVVEYNDLVITLGARGDRARGIRN